jgi:hypothetical protein
VEAVGANEQLGVDALSTRERHLDRPTVLFERGDLCARDDDAGANGVDEYGVQSRSV